MNLPVEKMFPELFADLREAPPEARRLESADFERALEVICASRQARGLPYSENGFRLLFRDAISRRDCCALATTGRKCWGREIVRRGDWGDDGASFCGRARFAGGTFGMADGRRESGAAGAVGIVARIYVLVGAGGVPRHAGCAAGREVWR